jgi:hypothetical protein
MNKVDQYTLYQVTFLPILSSYAASVVADAKAWRFELMHCKNTNTAVDKSVLANALAMFIESLHLISLYQSHIDKWLPDTINGEYKYALIDLTMSISKLMAVNQDIALLRKQLSE